MSIVSSKWLVKPGTFLKYIRNDEIDAYMNNGHVRGGSSHNYYIRLSQNSFSLMQSGIIARARGYVRATRSSVASSGRSGSAVSISTTLPRCASATGRSISTDTVAMTTIRRSSALGRLVSADTVATTPARCSSASGRSPSCVTLHTTYPHRSSTPGRS